MTNSIFRPHGPLCRTHVAKWFFYRIANQRLSGSGRSSRLVMQFHSRELPARNSVVIGLIQLLPEEDVPCCSIWASLIAERGMFMAYVPSGVSMALRKYVSPICSRLSCACPVGESSKTFAIKYAPARFS
jgi:hypothetical protein